MLLPGRAETRGTTLLAGFPTPLGPAGNDGPTRSVLLSPGVPVGCSSESSGVMAPSVLLPAIVRVFFVSVVSVF